MKTSTPSSSKSEPVYALSTFRIERARNPGPKDLFLRDPQLTGFGVRISPRNTKSFFVEGRQKDTGKVRRVVLGQYPLLSLKSARKRALEALGDLKYGSSTPATANVTLRTVIEGFLEAKEPVLRARSIEDYRMVFYSGRRGEAKGQTVGCFGAWMDWPVIAISGRAVVERYQALCEQRGVGTANKAMRVLNGALNYGKAIHDALQDWPNPVSVLASTRCKRTLIARTRHIAVEKVGLWLAAVDAERDRDIRLLFKLLLMTGLRSLEARSLRWDQLELGRGSINIGSAQAKNHEAITIPVNPWLLDQLRKKREECLHDIYVFQHPAARQGYLTNLNGSVARICKASGVDFTPHDLRRSFATYLDTVGTPFGVIKQLLNHKTSSDVTERYIQRRDLEEIRRYSDAVFGLINSKYSIDSN